MASLHDSNNDESRLINILSVCVLSTRSQGVKLSREPRDLFFGRDGIEFGLMHFFMRGGFVVFYHRAVMRRMGWRFFWHFL